MLQVGCALSAGMVALFAFGAGSGGVRNIDPSDTVLLLLGLPIPFGLLVWSYQGHNVFMAAIGSYIKAELSEYLGLGWERYVARIRRGHHNLVTSAPFAFLFAFAAAPAVVAVAFLRRHAIAASWEQWALIAIDAVILGGAIVSRWSTMASFPRDE